MKSLFFLSQLASIAVAANDWSSACHEGQCAWDVPSSTKDGSSASFQLWSASPSAIADITPAAGWATLTCSGSAAAQTVRIVCVDASLGCSHLLDPSTNPIGRIVRLTDECGNMPFARIAHMHLADDQTLPSVLSRRTMPPAVYDVALDTDFSSGSEHGPVSFALTASSRPHIRAGTIDRVPRGRFQPRAFADEQEQVSKRAYTAHGLRQLADGVEDFHNSFNKEDSASFPVNINKTNLNVFNTTIHCQSAAVPFDASVSADVDAVANAQFTLGIVATGTIIPPKLNTAAITAGMTGSIDGALRVQASADGTFSSPSITLLDLPLPGLGVVIPGIIQLGPAFKVLASATANLGNAIDTTVGLSYQVENASMIFPPDQGESGGIFKPNETPLQLSMETNVTGSVSLTGHLIPELFIGIDAFDGLVQSSITLSLDASATVAVNGTAGITDTSNSSAVVTPQGACVDVSTALAVNAGASADLFDIFKSGTSVNLFKQSFDLFNTCTGSKHAASAISSDKDSKDTIAIRHTLESSTGSDSTSYGSDSTYHLSARARPVSVAVPRMAPVEAQSLNKRDMTCPTLPFSIHTPTATTKATPTSV